MSPRARSLDVVLHVLRGSGPAAVAALFLAGPAADAQVGEDAAPGRIVVVAEGRASAPPDMAALRFGVEREADTAEEALDAVGRATRALLEALEDAGVTVADRQTGVLRLQPRRARVEGAPERIEGYVAATEIAVRLRDLATLGAVIDAGVAAGANRLQGLSFDLAAPEAVLDAARRDAVAEARRRAALYADAAGVSLGALLELSEADAGRPAPRMLQADLAAASGVPVAEGEAVVTVTLRLVYAIAD